MSTTLTIRKLARSTTIYHADELERTGIERPLSDRAMAIAKMSSLSLSLSLSSLSSLSLLLTVVQCSSSNSGRGRPCSGSSSSSGSCCCCCYRPEATIRRRPCKWAWAASPARSASVRSVAMRGQRCRCFRARSSGQQRAVSKQCTDRTIDHSLPFVTLRQLLQIKRKSSNRGGTDKLLRHSEGQANGRSSFRSSDLASVWSVGVWSVGCWLLTGHLAGGRSCPSNK